MKLLRGWALWGLLGFAGFLGLTAEIQAQVYQQPINPKPTSQPGQWQFDGNSWQYKQNGSGVNPVPGNGNGTLPPGNKLPGFPAPQQTYPPSYQPNGQAPSVYPGTQPYAPIPYQYQPPSKGVQIIIGNTRLQFSYGSPINGTEHWEVKYKKSWTDPWVFHGCYATSAIAFDVANGLSHKGFYAGVTRRYGH